MTAKNDSGEQAEQHFIRLYAEIREQAHRIVNREGPGCSVEATGLVHEAYEHVVHTNEESDRFEDPEHLLNALTAKMHRILLDRARRRGAGKRGGGRKREKVDLDQFAIKQMDDLTLISLRQSVEELEASSADSAALVKWHIYSGLTIAESAQKMGISRSKADTLWLHARHWLRRKMGDAAP